VKGRSYSLSRVIESCYAFEKYFFADFAYAQGEQGPHMDVLVHLSMYKGELNQRIHHVLRGSMDNIMYIKRGEYLGPPFALDVKGGEYLGVVVAIKSKGGDCWNYDTGVVLDGNSHK